MTSYADTTKLFLDYCHVERRMSAHTIRAYRLDLARFGEFLVGQKLPCDPAQTTKDHLRAYQQSLANLRPRTVGRRMAALRSFFIFAESEKLIANNPFEGLRLRTG